MKTFYTKDSNLVMALAGYPVWFAHELDFGVQRLGCCLFLHNPKSSYVVKGSMRNKIIWHFWK